MFRGGLGDQDELFLISRPSLLALMISFRTMEQNQNAEDGKVKEANVFQGLTGIPGFKEMVLDTQSKFKPSYELYQKTIRLMEFTDGNKTHDDSKSANGFALLKTTQADAVLLQYVQKRDKGGFLIPYATMILAVQQRLVRSIKLRVKIGRNPAFFHMLEEQMDANEDAEVVMDLAKVNKREHSGLCG
ncbi:hypothetical protein HK102_009453 [Quaeritorhiza haematococci]|nr:hypothetical protein HK102_009453 [Quaeritorhiza haematococci]